MSQRPSRPFSAAAQRALGDAIEWEELPSLAKRVQRVQATSPDGSGVDSRFASGSPGWNETRPGALEATTESMPFEESLKGLATREVVEPDVFRHFFGPDADE